jgi:hypothetical protein
MMYAIYGRGTEVLLSGNRTILWQNKENVTLFEKKLLPKIWNNVFRISYIRIQNSTNKFTQNQFCGATSAPGENFMLLPLRVKILVRLRFRRRRQKWLTDFRGTGAASCCGPGSATLTNKNHVYVSIWLNAQRWSSHNMNRLGKSKSRIPIMIFSHGDKIDNTNAVLPYHWESLEQCAEPQILNIRINMILKFDQTLITLLFLE